MEILEAELAKKDWIDSLRRFTLWRHLGFLEVKQKYQRSVLGPWWVSISMLVFILVLGTIFSRVFSVGFSDYMPYFSTGYLLWMYISTCLNESTELFRQNAGFIKQIKLPYSLYVLKFLTKNLIILGHNFIVVAFVLAYFQVPIRWPFLLVIPALILVTLNLYWMCLLISILSTRFRDIAPIITSCTQVLFFATPISWSSQLIGNESKIVKFNPINYFIELVRAPLLSKVPNVSCWVVVSLITLFGISISFFIFSRIRSRIPFWVD